MFRLENGFGDFTTQVNNYDTLEKKGLKNIKTLKRFINTPDYDKSVKTFTISDVELITKIPRSSIRDKEKNGDLKYDSQDTVSEHPKKCYNTFDINIIRSFFKRGFFNGEINRPNTLDPIVIAVSMFKGGVGKTTHSTHLAAHLCLQGLRTLIVDLDPQASASFVFGYIPSVDIESGETILNALLESPKDIKKVIKNTYYKGLDIITSGLELQSADLLLPDMAHNNYTKLGSPLLRLYRALNEIKKGYDVIILDCAPNHAATTMNALVAANGIIIPIAPNMLSYGSSIQFIHTLKDLAATIMRYDANINNNDKYNEHEIIQSCKNSLFRILITNDPGDKEAQDVSAAIRALYGDFVLPRPMCRTIALSRSSNDMGLLYDIKRTKVRGSKEAFDRGIQSMKSINEDILTLLKTMWGIKNE
jgi:chromosome partitioning protein